VPPLSWRVGGCGRGGAVGCAALVRRRPLDGACDGLRRCGQTYTSTERRNVWCARAYRCATVFLERRHRFATDFLMGCHRFSDWRVHRHR
jgi:hypothetical protein